MGIHSSTWFMYGARISDEADWLELEEDPGQFNTNTGFGYFSAGAYDQNMNFLVTALRELNPGDYMHLTPTGLQEHIGRIEAWDQQIRTTARRLNLQLVTEPGWLFVPDEK